jgi:hypothetical protein
MIHPRNFLILPLSCLIVLLCSVCLQAQMSQGSFVYVNSAKDEQAPFIAPDGKVTASANNAKSVIVEEEEKEEKVTQFIPDFGSGFKLNFGKSDK